MDILSLNLSLFPRNTLGVIKCYYDEGEGSSYLLMFALEES